MDTSHRPKIAETIVHETVRLREAQMRKDAVCAYELVYQALGG